MEQELTVEIMVAGIILLCCSKLGSVQFWHFPLITFFKINIIYLFIILKNYEFERDKK